MFNPREKSKVDQPRQIRDSIWEQALLLLDTLLELPIERRDEALSNSDPSAEVRALATRLLVAHARNEGPLERMIAVDAMAYGADALKERCFGRWRLQQEIGHGGMAVVYRAVSTQAPLDQHAAVKILTVGALASGGRERFLREQQLLARLHHPYIAPLYDAGLADDGTPWLAMALVDGERIDDWCQHRQLTMEQRVDLILHVAEALAYAHRNLVIHRDIKPSNVLVDSEGHVRLLDFGIARLTDELDPEQTATALRALTPEYAAPEQFAGGPPSTAMDVYGLGALLYRMLSGQSPRLVGKAGAWVEALSPSSIVKRDATKPEAQRRQMSRRLQGDLDTIVAKALKYKAERRYASIEALADDLKRWRERRPIQAHPPSAGYRLRKFVARHRVWVAASALVVVAICAALGVSLWQTQVAQRQAKRASEVRDFLVELLDSGKAMLPRDQRPTPELLVRQAVKRVKANPSIDLALRTDLLGTLGKVSITLGNYTEAEALLDEAIANGRKLGLAESAPEWLEPFVQKGVLLMRTNRNAEADKLFLSVLPQMRMQENKIAIEGLTAYAETRLDAGSTDEAMAIAREMIAKAKRVFEPDSLEAMNASSMLGQLNVVARRYDEGIAQLEPIVSRWRMLGSIRNDNFAQAVSNLAVAKELEGDLVEAEDLYREGIALRRSIYDGPHDNTAEAMSNFSIFLIKQERFEEAQSLLQEALSINRTVLGPEHHEVADTLDVLSRLEFSRRNFPEAERYARESAAIYASHIDATNQTDGLALARANLGRVLVETGKLGEALSLIEESIAFFSQRYGQDSAYVAGVLHGRAEIHLARNDPQSALIDLDRALPAFTRPGKSHPRGEAENRYLRALALNALGRRTDAMDELTKALSALKISSPNANARRAGLLALQARLYQATGRVDLSASVIADARALRVPASLLSEENARTLGIQTR
ncbi:protein kinase domain-containing protein [Lysobacter sp. CA199]|uniref:serine/threonine-protein kinase n=1 Tax=Lysobacter sp. CA199 TaxID=3455608 RepID=UPI003F8D5025